jgi:hypothetical protein
MIPFRYVTSLISETSISSLSGIDIRGLIDSPENICKVFELFS